MNLNTWKKVTTLKEEHSVNWGILPKCNFMLQISNKFPRMEAFFFERLPQAFHLMQ
jgi:hypothetical protein